MRRLLLVALVALIGVLPVAVQAQTQPQAPAATKLSETWYPYVVGLGAFAGVVGFNLIALGSGAIPIFARYPAGALVPAQASVAMSRVYATASAVTGALASLWMYEH